MNIMNSLYEVKKVNDDRWEFSSEAVLENFVWDHLERLLGWKPLRRQYFVDGKICDILALSDKGNLVVIELKNTEDRYVVQQLTRYYDALITKQPFSDQVDYKAPIELIIIAPDFHEDNLIDCKYSQLELRLFRFSVTGSLVPKIKLEDLQTNWIGELEIPFLLNDTREIRQIPAPIKSFSTALARCADYDSSLILETREKILGFHAKIEESQVKNGFFIYGKGKTKHCADFFTKKLTFTTPHHEYPVFALQLPISFGDKYRFSRVTLASRIFLINQEHILLGGNQGRWTGDDFTSFCQKGFGRTQQITQKWRPDVYLWYLLRKELGIDDFDMGELPEILRQYCNDRGLPDASASNRNFLNFLVEIALEKWLERLEA